MSTNSRRLLQATALAACALLLHPTLGGGTLPAQDQPPSSDLKIVIISGDGFTNNVKKRTAREEIVEVRDRNNSPVPGAIVTFSLLSQGGGAGGSFTANSANLVTVTTNQAGRAVTMFKPNGVSGAFKINVSASFQGQTATASLTQTNAVVAGGAAAAGGIVGFIASHAILTTVVVAAVVATTASVVVVTNGSSSSRNAKVSVGPPSLP